MDDEADVGNEDDDDTTSKPQSTLDIRLQVRGTALVVTTVL